MGENVLVPFDGSEPSCAALKYALDTFSEAQLRVVHVVEPFASHTEAGSEVTKGEWLERGSAYAREVLQEAADIADGHDRQIETQWKYGRPAHALIDLIENEEVDQVVMGSHGRSGLDRILVGSVAETVVRRATVPVTVVPPS